MIWNKPYLKKKKKKKKIIIIIICQQSHPNWHTIKPRTPEHETREHETPADQRNNWTLPETPAEHSRKPTEHQRNTSGTVLELYKTNNNCSIFKRKFKLSTQGWNILYCWYKLFIYFSLFKVGFHVVEKFN